MPLDFRVGKGWKWLGYTLGGILIYQIVTLQRPGFGEFRLLLEGKVLAYLHSLLLYYFVFELISVYIFLRLTRWYLRVSGLNKIRLNPRDILFYQLKSLPLIFGSIFIFGPITNAVRYLVVAYPDYSWSAYFPEYFFTARMYINYIIPYFIFGYALLNVNFFLNYHDWNQGRLAQTLPSGPSSSYLQRIEAKDEQGTALLLVENVWWFEVEGKSYRAFTNGQTYNIGQTIKELEASLDPAAFFRVNRAVIVNLGFVKNYSFWENDKYILRMADERTEFVMQRARLKALKERIGGDTAGPAPRHLQ